MADYGVKCRSRSIRAKRAELTWYLWLLRRFGHGKGYLNANRV